MFGGPRNRKNLQKAAVECLLPPGEVCSLIFFSLLFRKKARKTTKKARIFHLFRNPEILGKEGKNTQKSKEFLEKQKSKEIQKSKEKKIRAGHHWSLAMVLGQWLGCHQGSCCHLMSAHDWFWGQATCWERRDLHHRSLAIRID